MKRLIICIFCCFFCINSDYFAQEYDIILGDAVKKLGIFKGDAGIVYAQKGIFEERELLILVYLQNKSINCALYSNEDGEECVDSISFAYGGNNHYTFSKAYTGGRENCFILESNGVEEIFVVQGESFKRIYDAAVYDIEEIMTYTAEGIIVKKNPESVYDLLNSEKEKKISHSAFTDCKEYVEKDEIVMLLDSVSEVVEFDVENVDFVRLLKNILYTSQKYERIMGKDDDYKENSQEAGFEDIQSVDGSYIDQILIRIFKTEPQHISVNNLIENGVCYTNGRYFFVGGYTKDFNTEILELSEVYNLGGGRYYVIFCDKYMEEGEEIVEYSYAVIERNEDMYSLVRLSMGGNMLSDVEIKQFSLSAKEEGLFFKDGDDFLYAEKREYVIKVLIGVAITAFCIAVMAIIFGVVFKRSK